ALDPTGAERPDIRRTLDSLGMYSRAEEAVANLPDAKGGAQWKGTPQQLLKHLTERAGVKKAEIEATRLNEFLEGKKSVTKADIAKHLSINRMQMEEMVYGARLPDAPDMVAARAAVAGARPAAERKLMELWTKYEPDDRLTAQDVVDFDDATLDDW